MPEKNSMTQKSPARKIAEVLLRFPNSSQRKPGDLLPAALVKEVRTLAQEAGDYLKFRIEFVENLSSCSGAEKRLEKIEGEIDSLNAKSDKSEADYSRLILLERQFDDLEAQSDEAASKQEEAEDLLKNEMRQIGENLCSSMGTIAAETVASQVAKAISPFCVARSPYEFAYLLPKVSNTVSAYRPGFNMTLSGLGNARRLLSQIEEFLG
jgi:hypothetical protein